MNKIPFLNSPYHIYEGKFWNVILHNNQSYLGRCIVYLKSRVIDDPLLLTEEEKDEFWEEIAPKLASALNKSFKPNRLNYAHLANTSNFVHWHIVPRYEKDPERKFAREVFMDERVGRHYAPAPEKNLSREIMLQIRDEIKINLLSNL